MARLVYACRFEIAESNSSNAVLKAYQEWIEHHYRERRHQKNFAFDLTNEAQPIDLPKNHQLTKERFATSEGEVIKIEWAFPNDIEPGLCGTMKYALENGANVAA